MRLSACFLYTYMLLYHDCALVLGSEPNRKIHKNLTCEVNTCADRTARAQVCGCDLLCEVYGDCCRDYTRPGDGSVPPDYTRPGDGSVPPDYTRPDDGSVPRDYARPDDGSVTRDDTRPDDGSVPRDDTRPDDGSAPSQEASPTSLSAATPLLYPSPMSCVDTQVDGGYLLVSTCPTNWKPDHVSMVCESQLFYGLSPAYVIPVTSRKSGISYKNMFCAYCHGQTLSDIKLWPMSYACDRKMSFGDMVVSSPYGCQLKFDESTRRRCLVTAQDCRGVDVRGDKTMSVARDMCNRYTGYVSSPTQYKTTVYKNAYCQRCHRAVDTNALKCEVPSDILPGFGKTTALSKLADIDNKDYTHYKDPALRYNSLKEEAPVCNTGVYFRKRCTGADCLRGYQREGEQCVVRDDFTLYHTWCNPRRNTSERRVKYIGRDSWYSFGPKCENSEKREVEIKNEDKMMKGIRAMLRQTNYRELHVSSGNLLTSRRMFGHCQSTATTGTIADINVQLLAFMEQVMYNLTWPWVVNLTIQQNDGEMSRGNVSVCELIPTCGLTSFANVDSDLLNVSVSHHGTLSVCRHVLESIERREREQRNEKLVEFLKRAETIYGATDCCARIRMGVIVVVVFVRWVLSWW